MRVFREAIFRGQNVKGQGQHMLTYKCPISSEREGLRTSNLVHRPSTKTRISHKRNEVKVQGRKVTWSVCRVLTDRSRTKRPRNTKIARKVVHSTGNGAHQFQVQRSRSPGRLIKCWDRKCVISSDWEDLRTWYTGGVRRPISPTSAVTSKVKGHR